MQCVIVCRIMQATYASVRADVTLDAKVQALEGCSFRELCQPCINGLELRHHRPNDAVHKMSVVDC